MNEEQMLKTIELLGTRLQNIADTEAQAAWYRFIGVTSDKIEAITKGELDGEREEIINKINVLIDKLENMI